MPLGQNQRNVSQGAPSGSGLLQATQWGRSGGQNLPQKFKEVLGLQALVLMKDCSYTDICWESNTAVHKQLRRFLENVKDNLLKQLLNMSTRSGALLDLHIRKSFFKTWPSMAALVSITNLEYLKECDKTK